MSAHRFEHQQAAHACECTDPGCEYCAGVCGEPAEVTLTRIDFAGEPAVRFCALCARDALASGVFA